MIDAQNRAAILYAEQALRNAKARGFYHGPTEGLIDPTAVWRQVSAQMAQQGAFTHTVAPTFGAHGEYVSPGVLPTAPAPSPLTQAANLVNSLPVGHPLIPLLAAVHAAGQLAAQAPGAPSPITQAIMNAVHPPVAQ